MKLNFAFLSVLACQSYVLADEWIGAFGDPDNGDFVTSTSSISVVEGNPIYAAYADLSNFFESPGPKDTFVFTLNTTSSAFNKKNQILNVDVSGIREVNSKISLSVRACDYQGKVCYPGKPTKEAFSLQTSNMIKLNVADFGTEGTVFRLYLQVQDVPGKDNPNFDPKNALWPQLSDMVQSIMNYDSTNAALRFTLEKGK